MNSRQEGVNPVLYFWRVILPDWARDIVYAAVFALVVVGMVALVRLLLRKRRGIRAEKWHEAAVLVLTAYLAAVVSLTWTPTNTVSKVRALFQGNPESVVFHFFQKPEPYLFVFTFRELCSMLKNHAYFTSLHFVSNLLLFLPMGLLPPMTYPRVSRKANGLWFVLAAAATVELVQMVIWERSFDWGDLLAYLIGAALGYLLFLLLRRRFPKAVRATTGASENTYDNEGNV